MIARGNLRYCINATLNAFKVNAYPFLSILSNDRGHYYTVVTEEDLHKIGESIHEGEHRLVFRGTNRELLRFCDSQQRDLFEGTANNAQQNIDQKSSDISSLDPD